MVHAINAFVFGSPARWISLICLHSPSVGNTFDAFVAAAKTAATSTVPGTNPIGGLRQTTIDVGPGGNLTYFPPNITELVGTEVIYNFNAKVILGNSSVIRATRG